MLVSRDLAFAPLLMGLSVVILVAAWTCLTEAANDIREAVTPIPYMQRADQILMADASHWEELYWAGK